MRCTRLLSIAPSLRLTAFAAVRPARATTSARTYTVVLTVKDNFGRTDETTVTVTVGP